MSTHLFKGVPFVVLGQRVYDCHHGKDRKVEKKSKLMQEKQKGVKFFLFFTNLDCALTRLCRAVTMQQILFMPYEKGIVLHIVERR